MALRVLSVFGTRPEAIKMAPVVLRLAETAGIESRVCVTGQHRQMLDQVLTLFRISPHHDLKIMSDGQDLYDLTAHSLLGLREILASEKPDLVLVQGDTTTCFTAALAAFYANIPVGHVEAGLRTGDLRAPFPEEANRSLVTRVTAWHFAPTERARQKLRDEAVPDERILVTGNTVIDALFIVRDIIAAAPLHCWRDLFGGALHQRIMNLSRRLILITGHRRESFGRGFVDICNAIRDLAANHADWDLVYPVHMNPNVQSPVRRLLHGLSNVFLIDPLDYGPFVWLMNRADLLLTDSGGVQEEAPSLGKPVLLMREVTERPEAVEAGTVRLVGTDRERIVQGVEAVLLNQRTYDAMSRAHNPYGDGHASERIVDFICTRYLGQGRMRTVTKA